MWAKIAYELMWAFLWVG